MTLEVFLPPTKEQLDRMVVLFKDATLNFDAKNPTRTSAKGKWYWLLVETTPTTIDAAIAKAKQDIIDYWVAKDPANAARLGVILLPT